jgi:hypothetical protein
MIFPREFPVQGAALYAAGDAAAAAEKLLHSDRLETVESAELISRRWLGYFLVAVNLTSTFAYNILCKRALKRLDLQASFLLLLVPSFSPAVLQRPPQNNLIRLQPNVAAFLNNAYALPLFVVAALHSEGCHLGISKFAEKVAVIAVPQRVGHASPAGVTAAVAGARLVLRRRALSECRGTERSGIARPSCRPSTSLSRSQIQRLITATSFTVAPRAGAAPAAACPLMPCACRSSSTPAKHSP